MAVKTKKSDPSRFIKTRLKRVNTTLTKLEKEVERAVQLFRKKGEKSSQVIKKNIDEIIDKVGATDIYSKASEKSEEFQFELRKLADDVMERLKSFELEKAKPALEELKSTFTQIADKFQASDILDLAVEKAQESRNQVYQVLRIPTQDEVVSIQKKLKNLEKKVKTLSKTKTSSRRKAA